MRALVILIVTLMGAKSFASTMQVNCFWLTEKEKSKTFTIEMFANPGTYPVGTHDGFHVQLYSHYQKVFAIGLHQEGNSVISQGEFSKKGDMVSVVINRDRGDFFQFTCSLAE